MARSLSEHCILMLNKVPIYSSVRNEKLRGVWCLILPAISKSLNRHCYHGALSFLLYLRLARRDCAGEAYTLPSVCVKQM